MGRRGSDSEDRSSGSDPETPGGERAAGGGSAPGAWWDWQEDVGDLEPRLRPLARSMARAAQGRADPDDVERVLVEDADVPAGRTWEVVSTVRRSLDACRGDAPPEEHREARARLDEAAGRLWTAAMEQEVRVVREFVREVAHDLRSPLHSILFLTDALFREEGGPLGRSQKRQVSVVHSAAAALLRMSNDLLDFSGSAQDMAPAEPAEIPFSSAQVVGELENLLEPVCHHHKARLAVEVDDVDSRIGDPQILNRVLLNLAANAMEAVDEDGTVRVRVRGDDGRLLAVVEDDSGEADPEELRQLAEGGSYSCMVRRLGGQTRGLGLVICGRMIRAADGELEVERTEDGWTRFSVSLPFPALESDDGGGEGAESERPPGA